MTEVAKYPIAETFDSLQGEATFSGVRMFFIRMAGCSVGRPIEASSPYERCTLYDGRTFICDTNYRRQRTMTLDELLALIPQEISHVSITGGEPMNQNLPPLIDALCEAGMMVHIETSGTVKPEWLFPLTTKHQDMLWITCSPKEGCMQEVVDLADELKILVDDKFDLDKVPEYIKEHPNVFVSAINGTKVISRDNTQIATDIVMKQMPMWKQTTQSHKIWGVR